eukprot:COSAG01_NODE_42129_length_443_cov_1.049419_1_plen_53_part_10
MVVVASVVLRARATAAPPSVDGHLTGGASHHGPLKPLRPYSYLRLYSRTACLH